MSRLEFRGVLVLASWRWRRPGFLEFWNLVFLKRGLNQLAASATTPILKSEYDGKIDMDDMMSTTIWASTFGPSNTLSQSLTPTFLDSTIMGSILMICIIFSGLIPARRIFNFLKSVLYDLTLQLYAAIKRKILEWILKNILEFFLKIIQEYVMNT